MEPDPENPEVVLGADLLAPEGYGEIMGAARGYTTMTCC